jgi:hypothetical protein
MTVESIERYDSDDPSAATRGGNFATQLATGLMRCPNPAESRHTGVAELSFPPRLGYISFKSLSESLDWGPNIVTPVTDSIEGHAYELRSPA